MVRVCTSIESSSSREMERIGSSISNCVSVSMGAGSLPRRPARAAVPRPDVLGQRRDYEPVRLRDDRLEVYGPASVPAQPHPTGKRNLTNWNLYGGFYL
jgi:hypothetical protein